VILADFGHFGGAWISGFLAPALFIFTDFNPSRNKNNCFLVGKRINEIFFFSVALFSENYV